MGKDSGLITGYLAKERNSIAARYVSGKRLLDIGCESGLLRKLLGKGMEYNGIDIYDKKAGMGFRYA